MTVDSKFNTTLLTDGLSGNETLTNEFIFLVGASRSVISQTTLAAPGSPTNGDSYLIAGTGTGAFAGQDGDVAVYADRWLFFTPWEGLTLGVDDDTITIRYDGTNWTAVWGVQTLTDAANISWDLSRGRNAVVTLAGNRTLDNPTNRSAGTRSLIRVVQDATGSRTLAYGAAYVWAAGSAPTPSAGANAVDVLEFYDDGTDIHGSVVGLNYS